MYIPGKGIDISPESITRLAKNVKIVELRVEVSLKPQTLAIVNYKKDSEYTEMIFFTNNCNVCCIQNILKIYQKYQNISFFYSSPYNVENNKIFLQFYLPYRWNP